MMPWSLVALILKYSFIPYAVARYVTTVMGSVLLVRAWMGPEWVVKSAYAVRWLLTCDLYRRDEIGNAFTAGEPRNELSLSAYACVRLLVNESATAKEIRDDNRNF